MAATLPTRLRMSIAELDFIARAADLAAFPGLPTDVADPAADGVILDGLRAHGVIEGDGDDLELREDVLALLSAILECDVSLELEVANDAGALGIVVHLRDEVAILQRAHEGLVSLIVLPREELAAAVRSLLGDEPGDASAPPASICLDRAALAAAERGEVAPDAVVDGYVRSAAAPSRAGRAAARGTLYGEPRAACAWVAGPGGTYVLHDRGQELEIVSADGGALAEQLLSLAGSPR